MTGLSRQEAAKAADLMKISPVKSREKSPEQWRQELVEMFNQETGKLSRDDYDCPLCQNRGYTTHLNEQGYEYQRNCSCVQIRETARKMRHSGLGNMTKCTFDNFTVTETWQREMKTIARDFLRDRQSRALYIGGQPGCGKTHLCSAVFLDYLKRNYRCKYMIWCDESKRLKAIVNDSSYKSEIAQYKEVAVLYIDDFLKVRNGESPTSADINLAFEIINTRTLSPDKVTILSSEKTLDDIKTFDEALMSRIFQACGKYKISIGKDDRRNYRLK